MDAEPLRKKHRKVVIALKDAERRGVKDEIEALTTAVNIGNAMFAADYQGDEDDGIVDTPLIEDFLAAIADARKRFRHLDL